VLNEIDAYNPRNKTTHEEEADRMGERGLRVRGRLAFILWSLGVASAQAAGAGTSAASFLSIPIGGRPAALGGAYSALATDAYATVLNPAGLGALSSPQLAAMHLDYVSAVGYEFAGFARPLGASSGVGVSAQYLHPKDQTARDATGADIGRFSTHYAAYSLAFGRDFGGGLSVGATAKVIDAALGDVTARAYGGDIGVLYRAGPRLTLAAVAANLGTRLKFLQDAERLPDNYRLGAAFAPAPHWRLVTEAVYDRADQVSGRAGAEWRPIPALSLRAGYRSETSGIPGLTGMTTGLGLELLGQKFDFAWVPMGDFGPTEYFSLMIAFGKGVKK
jgi:hypothetical protein